MDYTLIANSGIQIFTFRIKINLQDRFKEWFHEWYDREAGQRKLELLHEVNSEEGSYYFKRAQLLREGYLANPEATLSPTELIQDGIRHLKFDDETAQNVEGEIYSMTFSDRDNKLEKLENQWLPIPYFFKRSERRFRFGPLNWSRFKLIPVEEGKSFKTYDVILAFDTRTNYEDEEINENPTFPDQFKTEIEFGVCNNDLLLLDYCTSGERWSYIDSYIMKLVHPEILGIEQLVGTNGKKMSYIASYIFLMSYIAKKQLFPRVKLYKDRDVEVRNVDMVIDIGNSRTTALLIEDNTSFNQVRPLSLVNFTDLLEVNEDEVSIRKNDEPFDMRLAFRKVDFGNFGLRESKQFVYPSLIRLGKEANTLIHHASANEVRLESLSTYSSPKRYLWDGKPNKEEWQFLVLPGEKDDHILHLNGVTTQLKSDGQYASDDHAGASFHYSRRSLMTLAFLEMLVQARMQINSASHRSTREGMGYKEKPRKIKRIIVTCPTAMSRLERESLVKCAQDAVKIISNFYKEDAANAPKIDVVPAPRARNAEETDWYYDEATCSQLVYMYGEVGHKYKGNISEFFNLYGKVEDGETKPSLTVGSLDIGAGTTDLMISKYTYDKDEITVLRPEPLFYDSFYYAGDDMLRELIQNVMLLSDNSAFRRQLSKLSAKEYAQTIKNFFGPDHNGQSLADRILRKDFNIQYSIPLMQYFLELINKRQKDCTVSYSDVFEDCPPNPTVIEGFKEATGIDITKLDWKFNRKEVADIIEKAFEPWFKKIATIMYAQSCDIVLLSGRPASLPPVRDIFLKYYPVSPDRLITLNNYYVGDWYPFCDNTGYITNPKTIVAMGGVIAHYASELSNLNNFVIDLSLLKEGLKSTANYIEGTAEGEPIEYIITPDKAMGDVTVSKLPFNLQTRQLGLDSYPKRTLYTIDFNRFKIADKIRRKEFLNNGVSLTDAQTGAKVNEYLDSLRIRMPFKITLERNSDDFEQLNVVSVIDSAGKDVPEGDIEVNIQSLGADDRYWLDTGIFKF